MKIRIGIDLDNTITASEQSIQFFKMLTRLLFNHAEIHIITNRESDSGPEIRQELGELGIRYHRLRITEKKAEYILKHEIEVFFENTDEMFLQIPNHVCVFKIREAGNFSFEDGLWIGGKRTTKMID